MEQLTPSVLSMLVLEFIKLLLRKFKFGMQYDFPVWFYVISLPVLNMISVLGLTALSVPGYSYPTDWLGWGKQVVVVFLLSLASVAGYELTLAKLKAYGKARAAKEEWSSS